LVHQYIKETEFQILEVYNKKIEMNGFKIKTKTYYNLTLRFQL